MLKYDQLFEKLNFERSRFPKRGTREYLFSTDEWNYKVSVMENETDRKFPWIGFRAKRTGDIDFNYDMDIITNDNIYLVMNTVMEIMNKDINENDNIGYYSSTHQNKKGNQRINFYKKMLKREGWEISEGKYPNYFRISK